MTTWDRGRRARSATLVVALVAAACLAALAVAGRAAATGDTFTLTKVPRKVSLSQLQGEAREVRAQMQRLNGELVVITRRYEAAKARFDASGRDLAETRLTLSRALSRLDTQRAVVAARAVALYKSCEPSFIDMLMGTADVVELQSGVRSFDRVARQDDQAQQRLEQLARDVGALERSVERERAEAARAKEAIDEQRAELGDRLAERQAILQELTRRIDELLAAGLPPDLGPVNGTYTQVSWAKALAQKLRVPVTAANVAAITAWELAEGGHWHNSAHYNPLNTTQSMPGATSMNSVGVKAYKSWAQGFAATLKTLHNGYYDGILAALQRGDDAQAVANAVGASPWGTGRFDVAKLAH